MLKKIIYLVRYLKYKLNKQVELDGFIAIQSNVKIIVEQGGFLKIGRGVCLKENTVIYCKKGAKITIGHSTSTGHHTEISANNSIIIGDNVIMGAYTYITDSNHRYDVKGVLIAKQGMSIGKTKIGSNVWLARNSMVLKDAEVGDNSVVAANSVVSKKFTAGLILGGVPAKLIKVVNEENK